MVFIFLLLQPSEYMEVVVFFPSLKDHSAGNLEFRSLGIYHMIESVFFEIKELSAHW